MCLEQLRDWMLYIIVTFGITSLIVYFAYSDDKPLAKLGRIVLYGIPISTLLIINYYVSNIWSHLFSSILVSFLSLRYSDFHFRDIPKSRRIKAFCLLAAIIFVFILFIAVIQNGFSSLFEGGRVPFWMEWYSITVTILQYTESINWHRVLEIIKKMV